MVTRKDVAIRAGVSEATVSHVVNNTKYVSQELKIKVEESIKVLNYSPNIVARTLATKESKHVGILVNDIANPYYGEIAYGMEEIARSEGYIVSLYLANVESYSYYSGMLQRQMDGLFLATSFTCFSDEQLRMLNVSGICMVNGPSEISSIVNFAYDKSIDKLIQYLKSMGHEKIGFLSGLLSDSQVEPRHLCYKNSLIKYGLEYNTDLVVDGRYPYETTSASGYEAMKELLNRNTKVTAVFATNDLMAFGAMKAIKERGLSIPKDISLVGCDNIFLSDCISPSLTTLSGNKRELGRQAMLVMLNDIRNKKKSEVFLDTDLIIRESTGPVSSHSL